MKKFTIILMLFVLVASACKKDEEEEETSKLNPTATQKGFAINYTATWCGHCGNWGAPLIHDYSKAASTVVAICAHSGDPMSNDLYASFTADRTTGGGIPSFWVGDTKTTNGNAMKDLLASGNAVAGVDYTYKVEGGVMTVSTETKFFSAGSGDYYLSVLVLEDGIDGSSSAGQYKQSGTANSYPNDDYRHDFVLRASSVSGNAYGQLLGSNPPKDKVYTKEYKINVDASWKNPYAVAIIWNKVAGNAPQYKFVNALKKK
jgi:hypothetical protein